MFTNLSNYGAPLCNYVNLCHYVNISWCGDLFQCARYWTTGDQVFVLHARYHPYVPEGHCRWDCWALADANLLPFASPAAQQSPSSGLAPKMVALKFASSSNGKRQQTESCASSCDDFDDDFEMERNIRYIGTLCFSGKAECSKRQLGRSISELVWFHRLILQGISSRTSIVCLFQGNIHGWWTRIEICSTFKVPSISCVYFH